MSMDKQRKKKLVMWGLIGSFLLIGLIATLLWIFIWQYEEYTDDAYVHGNQVQITPQIPGFITSVTVDDTDVVEEDRVLVTLDKTDPRLALKKAEDELANAARQVVGLFQTVGELRAEKEMKKAEMIKAAQDYAHRKKLLPSGGVSKEDFEHAEAAFVSAIASVLFTEHSLRKSLAEVENTTVETHPIVEAAKDTLREAFVNYRRTEIKAPAKGMIAMKSAQVGESVSPDRPLMTLVPLDQIWINANFKETQLKHVRLGQPVHLTSDYWGSDVKLTGKVVGLSAGTGSVFSVLPPQNATGNWIKIVQRLPVRVALDPKEVEKHPLRLGLSMKVTVDTHNRSGQLIPSSPPPAPLYETTVFAKQLKGAERLIEKILTENTTFSFEIDGK